MGNTKLAAAVVSAVAARLRDERGWRKRQGAIFMMALDETWLGWLGLNQASNRAERQLELNPVLGVRHQRLEKLLAELVAQKFHTYIPATSAPLGYLMPENRYRAWYFSEGSDVSADVGSLVAAIDTYGLPFMKDHRDLRRLCSAMASDLGWPHLNAFRIPLAYAMLGDNESAERHLAAELEALGPRRDAAAVNLRSFAVRLRDRLGRGDLR